VTENEKVVLRADFLKTWITTILAIIAGEVTLLNTFYKDSNNLWALYLSILLFMLAVISCLGAYESLVNKVTGIPQVQGKILNLWAKVLPKSDESTWKLSALGGVFIGLGIVAVAVFIVIAKT
jgi:hypothetical protein